MHPAFEIGRCQHRAHQSHRLVAHVGAEVRARDRCPDQAGAGEIGRDPRLREVGAVEPRARIWAANRFAPLRLAPVKSALSNHAWSRMARSSFAPVNLVLFIRAARKLVPERSNLDRSRLDRRLPVKSAGAACVALRPRPPHPPWSSRPTPCRARRGRHRASCPAPSPRRPTG